MNHIDYTLLYSNGVIATWYLREDQRKLYELLQEKRKVVTVCHRRWG